MYRYSPLVVRTKLHGSYESVMIIMKYSSSFLPLHGNKEQSRSKEHTTEHTTLIVQHS